jgi:DNA polymerase I-like protein with 3'-5' exonuclease and polymerase domains/uracil-DNA glycosylase
MNKPVRCQQCPLAGNCMVQPAASKGSEVIFLGTSPGARSAFRGFGGSLIRGILRNHRDPLVQNMSQKVGFSYTTWCKLGEDETLKKAHITWCRDNISMPWLETIKPKVIVAFGGQDISTFFGSSSSKKGEMRGSTYTHKWKTGGQSVVVYTISLSWLIAKPGLAGIVAKDIATAAKHYHSSAIKVVGLKELEGRFDVPVDLKQVKDCVEELVRYDGGRGVNQTLMSLDTETNTLFPWWDKSKIISISAAVSKTKALSFAVDHSQSSYELADVAPWVVKLTMSPHPKAWWNYKFDLAMFRVAFTRQLKEIMTPGLSADIARVSGHDWGSIIRNSYVNNTRWDGQLGEHLLEEDKAGFYSLKSVVLDYLPELYGYEDHLKSVLTKIEQDRLSDVEETLGELSLLDLGITQDIIDPTTATMDVKQAYDSAKKKLRRALRGFKAQGRASSVIKYEQRIKDLATSYSTLRSQILRGKNTVKADTYTTRPEVAGQATLWTYEDVPLDTLLVYGAIDAAATVHISTSQRKLLNKQSSLCEGKSIISLMDRHCLPLSKLFSDIQAEGVYVDTQYSQELQDELADAAAMLKGSIEKTLEKDFPQMGASTLNFKSDKDLANILVGWYGHPVLEETSSGFPSMKTEHLAKYRDVYNNSVAGMLIDYSRVNKARSDFVDKFLHLSSYDGKLHGEYLLHGTATGRASGRRPNLTNVPERIKALGKEYIIKKCIVATPIHDKDWWGKSANKLQAHRYRWKEDDELVVVDADLSGAEIRILTRYASDPGLIQAIKEGLDVHSWITSEVHGVPYAEIQAKRKLDTLEGKKYGELRDGTKGVVFKIIYGGTPEDKTLMNMIFDRFPAIPRYMADTKLAILNKEVLVTPNGRPRRFPLVRLSTKIERRNYRQGINFNVQSYCSDIVMSVLNNVYTNLGDLRGRLMLTVHDSIVFEVPKKEVPRIRGFLDENITKYISEEFPDIPVPMTYGYKIGKNYGEMSNT